MELHATAWLPSNCGSQRFRLIQSRHATATSATATGPHEPGFGQNAAAAFLSTSCTHVFVSPTFAFAADWVGGSGDSEQSSFHSRLSKRRLAITSQRHDATEASSLVERAQEGAGGRALECSALLVTSHHSGHGTGTHLSPPSTQLQQRAAGCRSLRPVCSNANVVAWLSSLTRRRQQGLDTSHSDDDAAGHAETADGSARLGRAG